MRWLNAQEWLEHERLTGLPHADFAHEALRAFDALASYEEDETTGQAVSDLEDVEKHVADFAGTGTVDRVEMAVKTVDDLIEIHGGEYGTVVALAEAADLRWWAVWDVLVAAGVVACNQKCADVDVPGLLRMFLPAE